MIYTVTLNPSLDYIVTVPDFATGATNRVQEEYVLPGGKGINVSLVLNKLGVENTAYGFRAGFVGEEIQRRLEALHCTVDFIELASGTSRINIKLKNYEGTEINGMGPKVSSGEWEQLLEKLDRLLAGDTLVLAGSIPVSLSNDIYREIMDMLAGKDIDVVVDASGAALAGALEAHPFLIKPNRDELGQIFGKRLTARNDILECAGKLQRRGARNVLVSLAGDGAVLLAEDGSVYESPAPKGELVNGVGAGDSMVAGFLAGWQKSRDFSYAFRMAVAAGSASAFSDHLAEADEIAGLMGEIEVAEKSGFFY
ncbi:MAG: 1-phosphofructokinase [Eubacterium sp.]|nr:1-phosphofructokinase [Eubacterium sp.]